MSFTPLKVWSRRPGPDGWRAYPVGCLVIVVAEVRLPATGAVTVFLRGRDLLFQQAGVQVDPQPRHLQHAEHGDAGLYGRFPAERGPGGDGLAFGLGDVGAFTGGRAAPVAGGVWVSTGLGPRNCWACCARDRSWTATDQSGPGLWTRSHAS
jgi:hypothetical protein